MKRLCLIIPLLLVGLALQAQITGGEYFFDTDPGVGNGTAISLTAGNTVSHNFTIPITGLSSGLHNLFIRVRDAQSKWSHYEGRLVYILVTPTQTTSQVVSGEWFVDTDPGVGNGTAISFAASQNVSTAITVPTTGLPSGLHNLFVRVKNSEGKWSHYEGRLFYILENPANLNHQVVSGEWFVDTDPGIGNATAISFAASQNVSSAISVPTNGMAPGFHNLFVRVKNSVGKWSHYEGRMFYILQNPNANSSLLVSGEWFIDNDPGFGNGTPITFQQASSVTPLINVSATGLTLGTHDLFIRVKSTENKWSHYEGREFHICTSTTPGSASIYLPSGSPAICEGHSTTFAATLSNGGTAPVYEWRLNGSIVSNSNSYLNGSTLQSGDQLTLAVTSSNACVSPNPLRDTIAIVVSDTVFSTVNDTICSGSNYTLPNGTSVSVGGQYLSYIVAANSCDSVVTTNLTVAICTGIDEIEASVFQLYPNPNNGQFAIEGNVADYTIEVHNYLGQLLQSQRAVEQRTQLDLQQQPSGIYHVSVRVDGRVSRFKVIKQ